MAKVGLLLAGCGVYDGSEIHEAVISMLALDRAGMKVQCVAPSMNQLQVTDHLRGEEQEEVRNVMVESARIARGNVLNIAEVDVADFDALVIPGGFGAAKNLCDFADKGADCSVNPDVEKFILAMVEAGKPVAAICIAPALVARVLGKAGKKVKLTIGNDADTAAAINAMGAQHVECSVNDCVVDKEFNVVSTPAYMLAGSIAQAAAGIEKTITTLKGMLKS
ncbi:MAG: isoprenoid biosynthesis glyoxalase ElbB [Desulfuromonas sp.]|nr:isoprenoid biosynthesis glyoxalase ElbB [Desulfuromonas sp.]